MSKEDNIKCSTHPCAPHGFDRNASHNEHRYVCDCEGWSPADCRKAACCCAAQRSDEQKMLGATLVEASGCATPIVVQTEARLWDSQWSNIMNAPEVLQASSIEEAVYIAVRMAEKAIADNVSNNNLPPARLRQSIP